MRGTHDSSAATTATTTRTPCASADPELWFAERPAELHMAKALCAHCPIKAACLAAALERREPWGVWGGEIVQQGVVLAYKRGRGRPSKADRRLGLVTRVADRPAAPTATHTAAPTAACTAGPTATHTATSAA